MLLATISSFWIALFAVLYFVLLVTLGIRTLQSGHWIMFIFGIFLPVFWLIGAFVPPKHPDLA